MDMFHPQVPAHAREFVKGAQLFKSFKRIIKAYPMLRCINADPTQHKIVIGTQDYLHVVTLHYSATAQDYRANTANRAMHHESASTAVVSKRANYIATALLKAGTSANNALLIALREADADKDMRESISLLIRPCYTHVRNTLNMPYGTRPPRAKDVMQDRMIEQLLRAYAGGVSCDSLSTEQREALTKLRDHYDAAKNATDAIYERAINMFKRDKVFVSYTPNGYYVGIYNAEEATAVYVNESTMYDEKIRIVRPLTYYKTLDDLPDDLRDPILAKLTMMSVATASRTSGYYDRNKFFPNGDLILEGANFISDVRGAMCWVTFDR
jgi:hypothetical protein